MARNSHRVTVQDEIMGIKSSGIYLRFFDTDVPADYFANEIVSFWRTIILSLLPYLLKLRQRFIFTLWSCQGCVFNNQSCVSLSSLE
jgi:hypothetical protein